MSGAYIHSLVATDISSGWTEAVPMLAREQSLVVEGLEAISGVFPVPVRGVDSDNDSVFINETLVGYCEEREIEFTRSRAYRKNDQAWIEQKNGSVIRRFVGHERHSGAVAGQTMAHLYGAVRLYVNYFQPSFQLLAKSRNGGSVTKRYSKPATPCDRLLDRNDVSEEIRRKSRSELDPVSLLHSIRESQSCAGSSRVCRVRGHTRWGEPGELPVAVTRPVETGRGSTDARTESRGCSRMADPPGPIRGCVVRGAELAPASAGRDCR